MTTWRRRLALRIDPTLQHPLDVARSTAVTLLNERRFQRLAETHANTLRTAAGMLEERYCEIAARRFAQDCLDLGAPSTATPSRSSATATSSRQAWPPTSPRPAAPSSSTTT